MSFMLTVESCRQYLKTVTRRNDSTWKRLKPLDILQQVEKAQGLKAGEKIKPIHKIIALDVRRERLGYLIENLEYGKREVVKEGFPHLSPSLFVQMYCKHNKVHQSDYVKRIEFRYLLPMDGRNPIHIPPPVARCPSCNAELTISPDGWSEVEQTPSQGVNDLPNEYSMIKPIKTWVCDSFTIWCNNEPDMQQRKKFKAWELQHEATYQMPYVYWLPVDYEIKKWLNKTFRFEES